ncbi:MAG: nucleotidyltransferase family protein [Phaeodactylibacter sp.]|nr:nucleotidyltransferase family protein [Phaeodactylibacter sp.]MCB9301492.1 nucleotidyltransferase family protein [Lewinellaceae bacterium]HQU60526.1 nucleotidyltransferase family protein [Saprospiraceae bacterium]
MFNISSTGIALLAAGASTRMGRPKQLLRFQGRSLLQHGLDIAIATPFRPIAVVLGANAELIETEIEAGQTLVVHNKDWQSGMGSSVATGLQALLQSEPGLEAAFFILVDQPYLDALRLLEMARQLEMAPEMFGAVSKYGDSLGVPALFRRILFPELLALKGQAGAKPLIRKYRNNLLPVPFPQGQFDLDTPEDWQAFLKREEE